MNTYKNYIDLLRNILKNFDNNEFDYIIKNILSKTFDEYYICRNDKIYCVDNLYKKYDLSRYNFLKIKYGIVKNNKLIYRFSRYSKQSYIIKLLKNDKNVFLENNETYESICDNILKDDNIKNYKKYIHYMYLDKFPSFLDENICTEDINFKIKILKKTCFHPPCLNYISNDVNYCSIHK